MNGVANVTVFRPPAPPSLKPASVAVARSAPVGTGVAPVVALMEKVMFGLVRGAARAEQLDVGAHEFAADGGVNVCPAQAVFVMPKPAPVTFAFD